MKDNRLLKFLLVTLLLVAAGCAGTDALDGGPKLLPSERSTDSGKTDTSVEAVLLELNFKGELRTANNYAAKGQIEKQLLFTVGQLNGENSVGRLDKVELTNIKTTWLGGGMKKLTYDAKLIVAWGKRNNVPESYTFKLPKTTTNTALAQFTKDYSATCGQHGHEVNDGNMWYYYRPNQEGCELAADRIVEMTATVTTSAINTTGKFPEYHKVWEDNALKAVVIFGKFDDGATTSSDAGISAYNRFVRDMKNTLKGHGLQTVPADVSDTPGVENPDVTLTATLANGKTIQVVILLIDGVRTAGSTFDARYASLTADADLIAYNGHSGLGANIRALARKGKWKKGQYSIVFMNGCDTFAYADTALADARSKLNDDDPSGTKYLDMVTNAMPSLFYYMGSNTLAIFKALMDFENPKTYEQIFKGVHSSSVVLVSGEEDNVYYKGYGEEPQNPEAWTGMHESGDVREDADVHYETPVLEPGTYLFNLSGDGDADLYVRIGAKPTLTAYDCRPYRWGTSEACEVTLTAPSKIFVMVRGWDPFSNFLLDGSKK